jgi:hypothetical protein
VSVRNRVVEMENSDLAVELALAGISASALILVVALPLLPAILIYKIFPKTHIRAAGNIGALTWNASGAFAAYIIVLAAVAYSPLETLTSSIGGFYSPTWRVEMEIHGYDSGANPTRFKNIEVLLNPEMHRVSEDRVILQIPGYKRAEWPVVQLNVPGGTRTINLASLKDEEIRVDSFKKHITILKPVSIKQVSTSSDQYPLPGRNYINE